ncbi:hypothetical protein PMAYCL1PPCAC_07019, partial [Pristionchus mayeri]
QHAYLQIRFDSIGTSRVVQFDSLLLIWLKGEEDRLHLEYPRSSCLHLEHNCLIVRVRDDHFLDLFISNWFECHIFWRIEGDFLLQVGHSEET